MVSAAGTGDELPFPVLIDVACSVLLMPLQRVCMQPACRVIAQERMMEVMMMMMMMIMAMMTIMITNNFGCDDDGRGDGDGGGDLGAWIALD